MNNHCSKFPHCHCVTTNQVLTCEFYVQPSSVPAAPAQVEMSFTTNRMVCSQCKTLPCEHFKVVTDKAYPFATKVEPAFVHTVIWQGTKMFIPCHIYPNAGPHCEDKLTQCNQCPFAKIREPKVYEEFGPQQVQYEHSYRVVNWLKEAQALGLKYSVTFVDDDNSRTVSVKLNDARLERMINDASIKRIYIELEPKMDLLLITKHEQSTKDTSASN